MPAKLRAARQSAPEAPIFQPDDLLRLVAKALARGDHALAEALSDLALEAHPGSPIFTAKKSEALEGRGEFARAAAAACVCAAMEAKNDWRAARAIQECQERVARLEARGTRLEARGTRFKARGATQAASDLCPLASNL